MQNKGVATKKRKTKQVFDVSKAVKAAAREKVGTPPPSREIPDAKTREKRRAQKHKATFADLLVEE